MSLLYFLTYIYNEREERKEWYGRIVIIPISNDGKLKSIKFDACVSIKNMVFITDNVKWEKKKITYHQRRDFLFLMTIISTVYSFILFLLTGKLNKGQIYIFRKKRNLSACVIIDFWKEKKSSFSSMSHSFIHS
jgi:hypothetical protein